MAQQLSNSLNTTVLDVCSTHLNRPVHGKQMIAARQSLTGLIDLLTDHMAQCWVCSASQLNVYSFLAMYIGLRVLLTSLVAV